MTNEYGASLESAIVGDQKDRVLVVDDNRIIADTTVLIFAQKGYEAKAAYSAEEALVLIRDWPPSAAILDVLLPKMNGIALARLMRLACPECRVALITTQAITGELFASLPDEFPVISKPVPPTDLLSFVSESLLTK